MMLQQQLLNNVALIAIVVVDDDCLLIMKDHFQLGFHSCCWETTLTKKKCTYINKHFNKKKLL
jgi:hypothetical protein